LIGPEAQRNLDDHVAEALFAARTLAPTGEVMDVGSGGGLPAIPMAIASPAAHFHLVEADQRKWAFLKKVVRDCALNSVVHGDRLDRLVTRLDPGLRFSLITSRAVGKAERWLPSLISKLEVEGRVALFEGSDQPPLLTGLECDRVVALPRGASNFLIILRRST
jgi:16S rRNA (guanine527-N7)-methyltransferase